MVLAFALGRISGEAVEATEAGRFCGCLGAKNLSIFARVVCLSIPAKGSWFWLEGSFPPLCPRYRAGLKNSRIFSLVVCLSN